MSPRISEDQIRKVFVPADSIDPESYIVVHYRVTPGKGLSLDESAAVIALNTSLGTTIPLSYETTGERLQAAAKILSTTNLGESGYVRIAYPVDSCGLNEGIPLLLTVVLYGVEFLDTTSFWIDNIDFPNRFITRFKGPRFGIEGIRTRTGIFGRPLIGTNIKPRRGVPLAKIVELCCESLLGGADYIMDDELLVDPEGELAFKIRVPTMVRMVEEARKRTGDPKWYIANITASSQNAYKYAQLAVSEGVNALILNGYTMGYSTISDLADDVNIDVPIVNTGFGRGLITHPTNGTGLADVVLAKFSRLSGADASYVGNPGTELRYTQEMIRPTITALTAPFHKVKPSMPIVSGGLTIADFWKSASYFGADVILLAGRGILGFPGGARKGASAFRTILENVPANLTLEEAEAKVIALARKNSLIRDGLRFYGFRPTTR